MKEMIFTLLEWAIWFWIGYMFGIPSGMKKMKKILYPRDRRDPPDEA